MVIGRTITCKMPECNKEGETMAHIEHIDNSKLIAYDSDIFYNATMAVGPTGTAPNRRDDVMLVQYLLKVVADYAKSVGSYLPHAAGKWSPPGAGTPFLVDGRMGPDTAAWIKSYQEAVSKPGYSILLDGRVDRALGLTGTISHTVYTIIWLNHDYYSAVPRARFEALEDDPAAPSDLRDAIRASRKRGDASGKKLF
jgi:hypothetical protein